MDGSREEIHSFETISPMRTTAVVCSFWSDRRDNVRRICNDLRSGSVAPDRIIIWNNGDKRILPGPRGKELFDVEEIHAPANYECRGKFIAGLLDVSDYYLYMDDDTTVGRRTLECFQNFAFPGCVFGYWGVRLGSLPGGKKTFKDGTIIFPSSLSKPVQVDAFHGRGLFVSYQAMVKTLEVEGNVRLGTKWPTEGDDLLIGLANRPHALCIPMKDDENFVDLDPGSRAMQHAPGYFEMRDEFLNDALVAMTTGPERLSMV